MLIANRKVENQVKTYITYNKGRDWRLLQAPTTDLEGNEIYCVQVRYGKGENKEGRGEGGELIESKINIQRINDAF